MPYEIRKEKEKYCVYNSETHESKGCSDSKEKATDHMRALYAAESQKHYAVEEELSAGVEEFGYIEDALYHLNILKSMPLSKEAQVHVEEALMALAVLGNAPADKVEGVEFAMPLDDEGDEEVEMEEFPWEGPIVFENVKTGDNRIFQTDAIQWDPETLPWPFRWQKHSDQGHGGAVPVGRVDGIRRLEDGRIWGNGVVIPGLSTEAEEYLKLLESGAGGGVSVDGDSAEFDIVDDEGKLKAPPKTVFSYMRLRALSAVDIPAFNEARIHLIKPVEVERPVEEVVEEVKEDTMPPHQPSISAPRGDSWPKIVPEPVPGFIYSNEDPDVHPGWNMDELVAAAIPVLPSTEAFVEPEFDGPTPLTITKDGRVFGHLALFNSCHIGFPGTCVKPPKGSKYQYFHTGQIETAEGDLVDVGHLTFNTGHAAMQANPKAAAEHYDNTGTVAADVRAGEDKFGIWVTGALRSHLTDEDIRAFRAAPLSGDWRRISGKLELVGALAVNVPGFPVPRVRALVASGETETLLTFLEDNNEEFVYDDYELSLRINKKLFLSQRLNGEQPVEFAGDFKKFLDETDDSELEGIDEDTPIDSLPDELPEVPAAPTKKDIQNLVKNITQDQLLHYLQDLRDLLDDPNEKISSKNRKDLEALYGLFVQDKDGKKFTASGMDLEEFYNHCHGEDGKFCPTGGGGSGSGGGRGVTGKAYVKCGPGEYFDKASGTCKPKTGGGGGGKGKGKGGGFDRDAHDKEQAVKQLGSYRQSKISARRWATTALIASIADAAVHKGLPLISIVGPISPLLSSPVFLTGLAGLGLYSAGKQLIAARTHRRDFSSTVDRINKRAEINARINRLNASKP